MIKAKVINQEEKVVGYCSFTKASDLLSKGIVKVQKFYPYTLMLKGSRWHDMALRPELPPTADSSQELLNV